MKKIYTTLFLLCAAQLIYSQSTQSFVANGTFTVPSGVTSITIEVVGAGGNGGGNGGGGGGGGGYAKGIFAVTPGTVLTVNIGTGGGGTSGGASSVTGFISATGGGNGTSVSNPNIGGGGAGGVGSNGNVANRTGGTGGGAYWTYFGGGGAGAGGSVSNGSNGGNTVVYNGTNCLTPGGSGGAGGGAPGGNGGKGAGFVDSGCNTADPAAAGTNYGGGGGGGNGNSSPAQNGAGGYCNITYGCNAPNAPINASATMTLCSGNSATLSATGSGTIAWYANPTGGSTVATGNTFTSPAIFVSTTFYAEAQTCAVSAQRTVFTVTVFALPVITVTASAGPYCVFNTLTLTASGGVSYSWSFGSTSNTQTYIPQNTGPQQPMVLVTDFRGCSNITSYAFNVTPKPTLTIIPSSTICAGQLITYSVNGASTYSWTNGPQASSFSVVVNSTSTFSVTGTSTAGCTNTAAITQTVLQSPTVTITGKTDICAGESVKLTGSGGDTYTWTDNGTSTAITVSPASSTIYTLTGFNTIGCSDVEYKSVNVKLCTGITEKTLGNNFVVYPNPSTGIFIIKAEQDLTLNLYSFSGQHLQTINLDKKNEWTRTLETLPKGIYFLSDEKGNHSQKLIVQ